MMFFFSLNYFPGKGKAVVAVGVVVAVGMVMVVVVGGAVVAVEVVVAVEIVVAGRNRVQSEIQWTGKTIIANERYIVLPL